MKTEEKTRKQSVVAKKIKRQRTFLAVGIVLALVVICLFTPIFGITSISVENNQILDDETIIRASGIKLGENVFCVDISDARDSVAMLGHIESVEIKRKFPSKIQIEVKEYSEAAYVSFAGNYVAIDIAGKVIDVTKASKVKADKPVITGMALKKFEKSTVFTASKPKKGEFVLAILNSLKTHDLFNSVKKIDITSVNNAKVTLNTDTVVVLGDNTQLDYKFAYLIEVLKELENLRGGEIDLSDTKNVLYKGGK